MESLGLGRPPSSMPTRTHQELLEVHVAYNRAIVFRGPLYDTQDTDPVDELFDQGINPQDLRKLLGVRVRAEGRVIDPLGAFGLESSSTDEGEHSGLAVDIDQVAGDGLRINDWSQKTEFVGFFGGYNLIPLIDQDGDTIPATVLRIYVQPSDQEQFDPSNPPFVFLLPEDATMRSVDPVLIHTETDFGKDNPELYEVASELDVVWSEILAMKKQRAELSTNVVDSLDEVKIGEFYETVCQAENIHSSELMSEFIRFAGVLVERVLKREDIEKAEKLVSLLNSLGVFNEYVVCGTNQYVTGGVEHLSSYDGGQELIITSDNDPLPFLPNLFVLNREYHAGIDVDENGVERLGILSNGPNFELFVRGFNESGEEVIALANSARPIDYRRFYVPQAAHLDFGATQVINFSPDSQ